MSNVVKFPAVNGAYCSGRYAPCGLSHDAMRQMAWANFYRSEREAGVSAIVAYGRADEFVARHFDGLVSEIAKIMGES